MVGRKDITFPLLGLKGCCESVWNGNTIHHSDTIQPFYTTILYSGVEVGCS